MNQEEQKLLNKMKQLIREGKRYFSERKDRDYLQDLDELGINEDEAWNIIESLNFHYYYPDPKPVFNKSINTLVFKHIINNSNAYIKLTINKNNNNEYTVCISSHKDYKKVIK